MQAAAPAAAAGSEEIAAIQTLFSCKHKSYRCHSSGQSNASTLLFWREGFRCDASLQDYSAVGSDFGSFSCIFYTCACDFVQHHAAGGRYVQKYLAPRMGKRTLRRRPEQRIYRPVHTSRCQTRQTGQRGCQSNESTASSVVSIAAIWLAARASLPSDGCERKKAQIANAR